MFIKASHVCVLLLAALITSPWLHGAEAPTRGIEVVAKSGSTDLRLGTQWALLIGINRYTHWPSLRSSVNDVSVLRDLLIEKYGYNHEHIDTLLNQQASGKAILDAFNRLLHRLQPEDSLLIYYAGHGHIDAFENGAWVPVHASLDDESQFIDTGKITSILAKLPAKHVFVVADSCYSGSMTRHRGAVTVAINDRYFRDNHLKASRQALSSGGLEPVLDGGKDGHSVFAHYFLKLLRENREPYLPASHLSQRLEVLVSRNAPQKPSWSHLRGAGDENGEFFFIINQSSRSQPRPVSLTQTRSYDTPPAPPRKQAYLEISAVATADITQTRNRVHAESVALKTARHLAYANLSESLNGVAVQDISVYLKTALKKQLMLIQTEGFIKGGEVVGEHINWINQVPRAKVTVRIPLTANSRRHKNNENNVLQTALIIDARHLNTFQSIRAIEWAKSSDSQSKRLRVVHQLTPSSLQRFDSMDKAQTVLHQNETSVVVKPIALIENGTLVIDPKDLPGDSDRFQPARVLVIL